MNVKWVKISLLEQSWHKAKTSRSWYLSTVKNFWYSPSSKLFPTCMPTMVHNVTFSCLISGYQAIVDWWQKQYCWILDIDNEATIWLKFFIPQTYDSLNENVIICSVRNVKIPTLRLVVEALLCAPVYTQGKLQVLSTCKHGIVGGLCKNGIVPDCAKGSALDVIALYSWSSHIPWLYVRSNSVSLLHRLNILVLVLWTNGPSNIWT